VATGYPASRRASCRAATGCLLGALVAVLTVAGCSGGTPAPTGPSAQSAVVAPLPTAPPAGSQSLSETGSTLLYPLFKIWAPAYESQFSNVKITTGGTGSSVGIADAAKGSTDIGASDAYLSVANLVQHPTLENVPLVVSAQFVSYDLPGLKGNLKLDPAVLAAMYQGTITSWNDPAISALNPGVSLPPTKVVPLHRSDGSGDTFLFTSYLSAPGSSWANSVGFATAVAWPSVAGEQAAKGNSGMVSACVAHPGCIAYIGISYLQQASTGGLGEARLLNSSGNYVLPDASSISASAESFAAVTPTSGTISLIDSSAAGAYPLVNYEYAIVSNQQASAVKAATIKALLNWILTQGSSTAYLARFGFQPLPSQVTAVADALIARIA
jgi:phosphate transport system substrate-binding protein